MAHLMDEENNTAVETYSPEDSSDIDFVCGDPQVDPRVGDEYQVEIPPMMSESEHAALFLDPAASEVISYASHSFLVGLPVQIMWIDGGTSKDGDEDETVDMNESLKSLKAKRNRSCAKNRGQSHENNLEPTMETKKKLNLEPVPGQLASSLEENEVESFLLGLYTFGKNFVQVKKFMESKEMGEILSFYYGKFYKSSKFRSWSDYRKKRNRKRVYGRKLFSGWRQQELLSRLIPGVPDESQKDRLLNVSKSFAEGNISLEKYVSSLKTIVGLRALVDAVAIGKEREDLTILATEPVKTKQWFVVSSNPPAAPGGGAYACLTSGDIIKQLTGGSRLSKARCNDIFWEAVWPRLLARGWHSEQPKDRGYVTSKDYLVFLVPGVRKFSRRKLVKGDHYFDSVSDILTKVASEPELLEFESREIIASGFDGEVSSESSDKDSLSDSRRQCYLRSPGSNRGSLRVKFTVVDTSLAIGGKLCDLRELRTAATESSLVSESTTRQGNKDAALEDSLNNLKREKAREVPLDDQKKVKGADEPKRERSRMNLVEDPMRFTIVDTSLDHGGKSSGLRKRRRLPVENLHRMNTSGDSSDEDEQNETLDREKSEKKKKKKKRSGSCEDPLESRVDDDSSAKEINLEKNQDAKTIEEMNGGRSKRFIKRKFIRRTEPNRSANAVPLLKRRRLSACVRTELSRSSENFPVKPPESDWTSPHCRVNTCNARTEVCFHDCSQEKGSIGAKSEERAETRFSIDMNLIPDQPKETEYRQCSPVEMQEGQEMKPNGCCSISGTDKNGSSEELGTAHEVDSSEQQKSSSKELGTTHEVDSSERQQQQQNGSSKELGTTHEAGSSKQHQQSGSSKELGTTHEVNSSEQQQQQPNTDVPRRQSTRKRPLTTRVLEALESGFFSTKKNRSPKPRKRASSSKNNHSNKARNKGRAITENENTESQVLERNVERRGAERSLLAKKAMTSKPLDQIEDKKPITEVPRLPPIVLKLSFRRG